MKYKCVVCGLPSQGRTCSDAFCGANCKPEIVIDNIPEPINNIEQVRSTVDELCELTANKKSILKFLGDLT